MNRHGRNFSRFRTAVLKATAMRNGRFPTSLHGHEGSLSSTLSEEEASSLGAIVFIAAIKVMLASGNDRSDRVTSNQLIASCVELYRALEDLCPPQVFAAMPSPEAFTSDYIQDVWSVLSDPAISEHWQSESALGYAYQFFCTPLRRESLAEVQTANKSMTMRQLITFTQLYTPDWVVDFLVHNTLLSQWSGQFPGAAKGSYLIAGATSDHPSDAARLSVMDPACGSGHFLLRATDLLFEMYREEGLSKQEALGLILEKNLFGVDIDPVALWICALSITVKYLKFGYEPAGKKVRLEQVQREQLDKSPDHLLGSLCQSWQEKPGHLLSNKYRCVVTNPPYIGRKLMDRRLKSALKNHYPDCHQDLCAAFLQLSLKLLQPGGRLGLIGQSSLMFLPTYSKLRKYLLEETRLISIIDAGRGVFPLLAGEKVNSALFVIESKSSDGSQAVAQGSHIALFVDLTRHSLKDTRLREIVSGQKTRPNDDTFRKEQAIFNQQRKFAFNYRCPELVNEILRDCGKLASIADLRQGLATTDNSRFVRRFTEIDPCDLNVRWFPYVKGAGSERWWSPIEYVVDWQDNGAAIKQAVVQAYPYLNGKTAWVVKNEDYYFKEGLTFSFVNSRGLAVRQLPPGCIFDVGGSAIFAPAEELDFLLGYLNSSFASAIAKLFNPTINFQVGDLKELPVLPLNHAERSRVATAARDCCILKRHWHEHKKPEQLIEITQLERSIDQVITSHLRERWHHAGSLLDGLLDWISKESTPQKKPASISL